LAAIAAAREDAGVLRFVSQRARRAHNAVRYTRPADVDREPPVVDIHPLDAQALAIGDGTPVTLEADGRSVSGTAKINNQVQPGVVSLTHGWTTPNVASLISPRVDPLTGQPVFSSFVVRITPYEPQHQTASLGE